MADAIRIADTNFSIDDALKTVQDYGRAHTRTLEIFDGLGKRGYRDPHPNSITLADIGRLVVINGRPLADDVPVLLDADVSGLAQIPEDASLATCEIDDETWRNASAVYEALRIKGIGKAKRSKLLHAKRPGLFFISDKVTSARYAAAAARCGGSWAAAREDLRQPSFTELINQLASLDSDELGLRRLSGLRVLDILCWSPA